MLSRFLLLTVTGCFQHDCFLDETQSQKGFLKETLACGEEGKQHAMKVGILVE